MVSFTIGTDIEVFGKQGQRHVSLCGKIGGTKEKPKQLDDMPAGFMVQEDNVSLEYNVPPAKSADEFAGYIKNMGEKVGAILKTLGLEPSTDCAVSFDATELTHPNALVFGCEPDYNAWSKRENDRPFCADKTLRTAGGHVHVGTSEVDMLEGIRAMDLFLGVPSIVIDDSPSSVRRRELYGKAGAMRPKPYGFEYRTLSNFWMFDEKLVRWVYNNTKKAMQYCETHKEIGSKLTKELGERVQKCINTGNKEEAYTLIGEFNIPLPGDTISPETPKYIRAISFSMPVGIEWVAQQETATPQINGGIIDDLVLNPPLLTTAQIDEILDDAFAEQEDE